MNTKCRIAAVSLLCTLAAVAAGTAAAPGDRGIECERIKLRIRKIESRMRAGYSRAQGEKMAEELRQLRALRAKVCR